MKPEQRQDIVDQADRFIDNIDHWEGLQPNEVAQVIREFLDSEYPPKTATTSKDLNFKILWNSEPDKLQEEVQMFIDAGWSLHGPLVMAYGLDAVTKEPRLMFSREVVKHVTVASGLITN